LRRFMMSVAVLATLAACSNGAAPNAANNAAPANTAVPANTATAPTATPPSGPPGVTGKFIADGKTIPLTFVTAYTGDPNNGKPVIHIIFSDKSQSGASGDAPADAYTFKFGNSIDLSINPDGTVLNVDFASKSFKNPNFSSSGDSFKINSFANGGGFISGELSSGGQIGALDTDKLEIDLTFKVAAPAPAPAT
jgi:hypothetical protein